VDAHATNSAATQSGTTATPRPQTEHAWLQQFVGDWESDTEFHMDPDRQPEKSKTVECIRPVGGFWIVIDIDAEMMGAPFHGIQTLGYDPKKKTFTGTWVDSVSCVVWTYTGTLNKERTALTLYTEGPCPTSPNKLTNVKDVLEIKDRTHKLYTSYILDKHGDWSLCMEARGVLKRKPGTTTPG
jgi:hypothetical protein